MKAEDIFVFDLRMGRVGGMSFCEVLEEWFSPQRSFFIDNDTDYAVSRFEALSEDGKLSIKFVWGHNFAYFFRSIPFLQSKKVWTICLLRHPLLKLGSLQANLNEVPCGVDEFRKWTVAYEFEQHALAGADYISADDVSEFYEKHYFVGITELMDHSLYLLATKLGFHDAARKWQRRASSPSLDNFYANGTCREVLEGNGFFVDWSLWTHYKNRLLSDVKEVGISQSIDLVAEIEEGAVADDLLTANRRLFPQIFSRNSSDCPLGDTSPEFVKLSEILCTSADESWISMQKKGFSEPEVAFTWAIYPVVSIDLRDHGCNFAEIYIDLPLELDSRTQLFQASVNGETIFRTYVKYTSGVRKIAVPLFCNNPVLDISFTGFLTPVPGDGRDLFFAIYRMDLFHLSI